MEHTVNAVKEHGIQAAQLHDTHAQGAAECADSAVGSSSCAITGVAAVEEPPRHDGGLKQRTTLLCEKSTLQALSDSGSGSDEEEDGGEDDCDGAHVTRRALRYSAYAASEIVGKGAYGKVWSGVVRMHPQQKVAIKHIDDVFRCRRDAVRTLRELRLLKLLQHPRIVALKSVVLPVGRRSFGDLHMVFDLCDCDLAKVRKTPSWPRSLAIFSLL